MKGFKLWGFLSLIFLLLIIVGCGADSNSNDNNNSDETETSEHTPPSIDDLDPDHPKTAAIEYGQEIFNETDVVLPESGNELSCQSCHADGGVASSSTLVGVAADYPQYRPREGVTFTLEDRINGCMIRSMNGEEIDYDGEEMRALMAYLTFISEGVEIGQERPWFEPNSMDEVPEPDIAHGEDLYEEKNCLSCHGDDGSGTGANSGPALWGENSFNDGAGMGRLTKMAGYIQNNMPVGQEDSLTDQEAADLAAFLLSHDRPEWKGHDTDFPHGKRPTDIITKDRRQQMQNGTFDWTEIENVIPKN